MPDSGAARTRARPREHFGVDLTDEQFDATPRVLDRVHEIATEQSRTDDEARPRT